MPSLFVWILSAIGPIAKRLLASIGVGWITYEGYSYVVDQAKSSLVAAWGGMTADAMSMASASGFGVAFGIVLGAFTFKITSSVFTRLGKLS